jgi:multidrug efflux system membrane fusion protein
VDKAEEEIAMLANRFAVPRICFFATVVLAGCTRDAAQVAPAQAPAIPVSKPVVRNVTDHVDFTGRTEAMEAINIVPRVTGYLVRIPFKAGSEVKAGDELFEIDSRPYKAQLDQAEGQVKLYQAQLLLAKTTLARDVEISKTPGAVSAQQLDQDKAAVDEAEARVKAYQASTEVYKLNLSFTKVTSPIDGRVSRYFLAIGNLVNQDQTLLTTVVSEDPMWAYFDMDEPTWLRARRAVNEGRIKLPANGIAPVFMGLQGEDGYPHAGVIDFVNNQFSSTTGSIPVRGVFPNPKPAVGARLLLPGMFVRIRLPLGDAHSALLVIDRAILSDQGLKKVYVVDDKNTIQERRVLTGTLQEDGLREITDGLKDGDRVVVGALQQVRPRMEIRPEMIAMPSLGRPTADDSAAKPPAGAAPAKTTPPNGGGQGGGAPKANPPKPS